MRIDHNIKNLAGGVSQQEDELRYDNQVEEMENCLITVAQGLRRRNPVKAVVSTWPDTLEGDCAFHTYERGDGVEAYIVTIGDNYGCRVWDKDGNPKTVNQFGFYPYWHWRGHTEASNSFDEIVSPISGGYDYVFLRNNELSTSDWYYVGNAAGMANVKSMMFEVRTNGTAKYSIYGYNGSYVWYDALQIYADYFTGSPSNWPIVKYQSNLLTNAYQNRVIQFQSSSNWRDKLRLVTVGDTTWILDTEVVAQSKGLTSPTTTGVAFYWIKRSFDASTADTSGYTYQVVIGGTTWTANHESTTSAATALVGATGSGGTFNGQVLSSAFTTKVVGSVIRIKEKSAGALTGFASGDSWGNQASFGWVSNVSKVSDLPADMNGFTEEEVGTIAISGTDRDNFTNYYIKWNGSNWVETLAEGILTSIDEKTLPAKLVRQSDGTFTLGFNVINDNEDGFTTVFSDRKAGDDDSNPMPSFIGNTLSSIFFFKNRLGFTSGESVILSETGDYGNFFATTAMEVLDSDVIDVSIDSESVSIIRHVTPTAGSLTLWCDDKQFLLAGGDVLSPLTTRVSQTSSYACDTNIPPVAVDNQIIFASSKNGYAEFFAYNPAIVNSDRSTAESISAHIPEFVPDTVRQAVSIPEHNMVIYKMNTGVGYGDMYIYKYHIANGQKIISAWHKWTFDGGFNMYSIDYLDNKLYGFNSSASGYIASIELEPKAITDTDFKDIDSSTGTADDVYLSKVTLSRYNVGSNYADAYKASSTSSMQSVVEPLYLDYVKINLDGNVDLGIESIDRGTTDTLTNVDVSRNIFVGGNSDNTRLKFSSNKSDGFRLNNIALTGRYVSKTKNV